MNKQPIGIFDSGVGGLSILQHIHSMLPQENSIYVADSGYAPYGCQNDKFVFERSKLMTEFLLGQGAKAIVIACNTATASIIEQFRVDYQIPFVGVEPGIKPAVDKTQNGKIAVMATTSTIASQRYRDLCRRFGNKVEIIHQTCPGLADQVEQGLNDKQIINQLLDQYTQPLLEKNVDTIVLGCTHYSFLTEDIRRIVGTEIQLIDTSYAVAKQVDRILHQTDCLNHQVQLDKVQTQFFTTGSQVHSQRVMQQLLNQVIEVSSIQ